jgi:hypothetical protein
LFRLPLAIVLEGLWLMEDKRGVARTATVGQEVGGRKSRLDISDTDRLLPARLQESKADPLTPALYTHWPHASIQRTKHNIGLHKTSNPPDLLAIAPLPPLSRLRHSACSYLRLGGSPASLITQAAPPLDQYILAHRHIPVASSLHRPAH